MKVQDINDNPPEFLHGPYYARVPEMSNVCEYKYKAYFNPTKNKISKTLNKKATGDYFLFPDDVWHFLLRHVIRTLAWDACCVENMPAYGSYIATAAPRDALTTISGAWEEWATAHTEYLSLTKSEKRSTSVLEIVFTRINRNINTQESLVHLKSLIYGHLLKWGWVLHHCIWWTAFFKHNWSLKSDLRTDG